MLHVGKVVGRIATMRAPRGDDVTDSARSSKRTGTVRTRAATPDSSRIEMQEMMREDGGEDEVDGAGGG